MPAEVGERRILRLVVTVDRSQLQLPRGLRNAAGAVIPLAVGAATGEVAGGVAVAGGALLVGFAEQGASFAGRARAMLVATALVGGSTLVGTLAGEIEWLTVLLMAVWGFAAGLTLALGPAASFQGILGVLALLLSAYYSGGFDDGLERAGLAIAGGLLQTGLAVAIWPLRPYRPERAAVANAYRALAAFVDAIAAGAPSEREVPKLTVQLGKARALLDDAQGRAQSTTPAGEAFRTLVVEADRAYPEVTALGHVRAGLAPSPAAAVLDALEATAAALRAIAAALGGGAPAEAEVERLRARLRSATATLAGGSGQAPQAAARLDALRAQLRAAVDAATGWTRGHVAGSRVRQPVRRRRALLPHDALAVLRANLSLQSIAFRHGIRMGVTLAIATALYRALDLPRGYWVPLTVAFVLRADYGSTVSRGLQRYAGTVLGAVLATALTAFLDPGDWTLVVLVGIFAVGIYALLFANYLLFTTSMTTLIVFFVAFDGVSEWTAVVDRLLDTAIGGALTVAAYMAWPSWEGDRVSARLADLIDADRRYLSAVIGAWVDPARYDRDALHTARLAARRARTEAEASVQIAQAEPQRHRGDIDLDLDVLAGLRRLADGALALEAGLEDAAARTARPQLGLLAQDLDGALERLAAAERNGATAARLPALRADHDALAGVEQADSLVTQETDRMVNAVDTLRHLLGASRSR
jgi:uncharacterized membrane protein YccC